jgi:tRNA nucleotidyltransferase (CCA-adding enzyme)
VRAAVGAARKLAKARGEHLYLAGGVVRDLLSGRRVEDVDLAVEDPSGEFVRRLARLLGASLRVHDRFGTATLSLPDGARLDVAATRREAYRSPGVLPEVELGATIQQDLARRDFTVNAMALEIAPGRRLVDPFGGRKDLSRRVIRALHDGSFRDDPTRALRAVRYAVRLGFRFDPATRRAISGAVRAGAFDRVSGARLRAELAKILDEPGRADSVRRMRSLRLDAAIEPALARATGAAARIEAAEALATARPRVTWLCYLLAWMAGSRLASARRVAERLDLRGPDREKLLGWAGTLRRLRPGFARLKRSEAARLTAGLSDDEVVAAAALLAGADRRALLARGARGGVALRIRGSDLLAAGIPAGPAIGKALARTRDARLDREISARDELAFAVRSARSGARRA